MAMFARRPPSPAAISAAAPIEPAAATTQPGDPDGVQDERRGGHFAQARHWHAITEHHFERSTRFAWRVVVALTLALLSLSAAFIALLPLQRVIPAVIEVDRSSGDARLHDIAGLAKVRQSEILDKYWVQEYVTAREGYHWGTLQTAYNRVVAMSEGEAAVSYARQYDLNSPASLDKVLGANTERRVRIVSISLPPGEEGRALVRMERSTVRAAGGAPTAERFLVTLGYSYKPAAWSREKEAVLNPLGFRVHTWRADAEFTPAPAPAAQGATP